MSKLEVQEDCLTLTLLLSKKGLKWVLGRIFFVNIVSAQEASSILKTAFDFSKLLHLHKVYLVNGPCSSLETVM